MADNKNEFITESLIVNNVRVCYTQHLFKRDEPFRGKGEGVFRTTLIIPKTLTDTVTAIQKTLAKVAVIAVKKGVLAQDSTVKAVKDGKDGIVGKDFGYPLLDGDKFVAKSDKAESFAKAVAGCWYMEIKSSRDTFFLVDEQNRELDHTDPATQRMFWSGDTVNADVTFNAYGPTGKKILGGISVWMNGLQKVKDGDGRQYTAVNRFKPIATLDSGTPDTTTDDAPASSEDMYAAMGM